MRRKAIELSPSPPPTCQSVSKVPDWRLAIDFGTTHTTIAFIRGDLTTKENIFTIEGFPGDRRQDRVGTQVPTEILYLTTQSGSDYVAAEKKTASKIASKKNAMKPVLYGYEITRLIELPGYDPERADYKPARHVTRPKLLLDNSAHLEHLRTKLMAVLKGLTTDGTIKKNEDVIRDFLVCYFQHTKHALKRDFNVKPDSNIEVTICVPVCWSPRAHTTMSACIQEALRQVEFGTDGTTFNMFMVNEAEAAAMHVLTSDFHDLKSGDTFILVDCGGGTTDAGTYTIAHDKPLRLGAEVTRARGAVCGSTDLNERMRNFAIEQLKGETYLEDRDGGLTIENIVEAEIMPYFETDIKRYFSIAKSQTRYSAFRLRGLKESQTKPNLKRDTFVLSYTDMLSIFQPSLDTIERLMEDQISGAIKGGTVARKVIVVGGFGDSPALRDHLTTCLTQINRQRGTNIEIIFAPSNTSATGVAVGAITRALNKENGPERVPCQSIGILRHVPYEPEVYSEEVLAQEWEKNDIDEESYIRRTIQWVIKVGQGELKPVHRISFKSVHDFAPSHTKWIAEELLYASDTCTEDFFTRFHVKNKGKTTEIGRVKFDITHLRRQIQRQSAAIEGTEYYEVILSIDMELIDRNLEITARWPADDENGTVIQGSRAYVNLVSAFAPGTA